MPLSLHDGLPISMQGGRQSGIPFTIDPSRPPQGQAAIRGNEQAWAQAPDMGAMPIPQTRAGASPFIGRRPEDQAGAVAAAEERAKLSMLPTRNAIGAHGPGMPPAAPEKPRITAEFRQYESDARRDGTRGLHSVQSR